MHRCNVEWKEESAVPPLGGRRIVAEDKDMARWCTSTVAAYSYSSLKYLAGSVN